jgi:signal transduction histidine kinase
MSRTLTAQAEFHRDLEKAAAWTGKLAHDFGNALTSILGFAELSLEQLPASSPVLHYVKAIRQSVGKSAKWIRKLQLFARDPLPHFSPAAVEAVVANEATRVRSAWKGNVAFRTALAPDLPPVAIEAEALQQAIAALLDNAREAIAVQGVVTLSARCIQLGEEDCRKLFGTAEPGPHVEIAVQDTGIGLRPEVRERLFRELFLTTKPGHRGLGLTLVYSILQDFRAGLSFDHDVEPGTPSSPAAAPVESGTTVRLYVPAHADGARMPAMTTNALHESPSESLI